MCYLNELLHFLSVGKKTSWRDQCEDHSHVFLKEQITILHMMLIYNMAEKKPLTEGDLEMETDLIL